MLAEHEIDTLVVVGGNFPNCPRATLVEASERDYRLVAVTDAISRVDDRGTGRGSRDAIQLMSADEVVAALANLSTAQRYSSTITLSRHPSIRVAVWVRVEHG